MREQSEREGEKSKGGTKPKLTLCSLPPLFFLVHQARHETSAAASSSVAISTCSSSGNNVLATPSPTPGAPPVSRWRQKERTKTTAVALALCLNIGVDPPDVLRLSPCARLECWVDPLSMAPPKALETVGKNLQAQYERWQPRARYRAHLDPTLDDVRKLAASSRRAARGERVLFHYNGHGVPRPTANGEVWVFNKS